jgi:TatA/E family protein of Tat protein translocase
MGIESPVHLLFIAVVALIVLGPKRLPEVARALGQGIREFRGAMDAAAHPAEPAQPPPAQPPPAQSPTLALPPPAVAQAVTDPAAVGGTGDPPGVADRLEAPDQGAAADEPR